MLVGVQEGMSLGVGLEVRVGLAVRVGLVVRVGLAVLDSVGVAVKNNGDAVMGTTKPCSLYAPHTFGTLQRVVSARMGPGKTGGGRGAVSIMPCISR